MSKVSNKEVIEESVDLNKQIWKICVSLKEMYNLRLVITKSDTLSNYIVVAYDVDKSDAKTYYFKLECKDDLYIMLVELSADFDCIKDYLNLR